MFKALLKKQFRQMVSGYAANIRKDKNGFGSPVRTLAVIALFVYVLGFFAVMFYNMADGICPVFISNGLSWFYFTYMSVIALVCALIMGIMNTKSQLYDAKDNELLLSLPIPTSMILFVRMIVLYLTNVFFVSLVMIPAYLVYGKHAGSVTDVSAGVGNVGGGGFAILSVAIISILFMALLVQVLSCVLGFLVAFLASKTKHKNLFTTIFSLAFLALYFYFYFYTQISTLLNTFLAEFMSIGQTIKSRVYPLYVYGMGMAGDVSSLLISCAVILVAFLLCYGLLSATFLKIVTTKKGHVRRKYRVGKLKSRKVEWTLLSKEFKRLLSSPVYLLNSAMGTLFMLVVCVLLIIKGNELLPMLSQVFPGADGIFPIFAAIAFCCTACMNTITAPSISLEGKNLWQIRSLPIPTQKILYAKVRVANCLTMLPAVIGVVICLFILRPEFFTGIFMLVLVINVTSFLSLFGLRTNLMHPNLTWVSEAQPVKQSMSTFITMFGGMGVTVILVLATLFLHKIIAQEWLMLIYSMVFMSMNRMLHRFICGRGCKIFESL